MTVFIHHGKTQKFRIIPSIKYFHPVYVNGNKIIYGSIRMLWFHKQIDFMFNGQFRLVKC